MIEAKLCIVIIHLRFFTCTHGFHVGNITRSTTTIGSAGLELLHNVSHVSEDCVLGANTEVPCEDSVLGPTWHDSSDPLAIAYQQNEVPTATDYSVAVVAPLSSHATQNPNFSIYFALISWLVLVNMATMAAPCYMLRLCYQCQRAYLVGSKVQSGRLTSQLGIQPFYLYFGCETAGCFAATNWPILESHGEQKPLIL